MGTTNLGQSGSESNGNKEELHITISSLIYPGTLFFGGGTSADVQLVYSTAPAEEREREEEKKTKKKTTHFSLPNIGESPMMTEANADLTCWFASETSSLTHGRIFVMIKLSRTSGARYWQKSGEWKKILAKNRSK